MNTSLAELLENLKPGLLWVTRDGVVRYANGLGVARTGLVAGRKLFDPDLARAVQAAVATGAARQVECVGVAAAGAPVPTLTCRVLPGLSRDDAFVLMNSDGPEDGAALDNLMQVIGSDLTAPLKQTQAALQRLAPGADAAAQQLADGVRSLVSALETLIDLSSVWRSGALLANDRIELWPLLMKVWTEIEPLAAGRKVQVVFRAQTDTASLATLYGSETWLGRVVQECLEGAVRAARPGATLLIEHRQMGPRALIVFRDSGVFASSAIEGVPLGRTSRAAAPGATGAGRMAARERIGLELCRHVLALHGGQLRAEQEDGLRNLLIDLPTGAPHRAESSAIDIAQVQQYAHDLAALMSRERQRMSHRAAAATPSSPVPADSAHAPTP